MKRRTFLESAEWTSIPWQLDIGSKSHQNQVADILVCVPGLLEDAAKAPDSSIAVRNGLLQKACCQLKRLFEWRWEWEADFAQSIREVQRQTSIHAPLKRAHQASAQMLWFPSVSQSSEIMVYNATLLWLLSLVRQFALKHAEEVIKAIATSTRLGPAALANPLFRPGETCTMRGPAIEICRCYEYQVSHSARSREPALFYLFPLALAGTVLDEDPQFSVWIRNMLDLSSVTSGYGVDRSNTYGFRFYLNPEDYRLK